MWKVWTVNDDWGTGYEVVTVRGKDAKGEDIVSTLPCIFSDEALAHVICEKLNDNESICQYCNDFKNGSCLCNCEDECEEGYYEGFEPVEEDDIKYERVKRSEIEGSGLDVTFSAPNDKKDVRKKGADMGRLTRFSKVFDFWATAALMIIAAIVFTGLTRSFNVWWAICLYWGCLLVKNAVLFLAHRGLEDE